MVDLEQIYRYLRSTDGVNQLQRSLSALDPSFVPVDGRNKSDIISFVRILAKQIRFFDLNNEEQGDWSPFFDFFNSGSSIIAKASTIEALQSVSYNNGVNGTGATLTSLVNGELPPQDRVRLLVGDLLLVWQQADPIQNGVYKVSTQGSVSTKFVLTRSSDSDHPAEFDSQIVEVLQGTQNARRLFTQQTTSPVIGTSEINYLRGGLSLFDTGGSILVKAAATEGLSSVLHHNGVNGIGATLTSFANGRISLQDGVELSNGDLLLVWQQTSPLQNGVYAVTQGTGSTPFVLTRSTNSDQTSEFNSQIVEVADGMQNAKRLFTQKTMRPIVGTSDIIYVRGGLSFDDWPPHLAMFIAFLHLYSIAQSDINELTGRHLRYYYENVLQLQRKLAHPDQVHVVFEPAKNAPPVLLSTGTLLAAGKTSDGKALRQYALDSDIVVNHAVVKSLKSTYTDLNSSEKAIVFKAEDATLVQGYAGSGWRPFGSAQLNLSPESRTMVEANLGFAIASPALLLAEGERKINITLNLQTVGPPPSHMELTSVFEIALTGDKEWVTPVIFMAELIAQTISQPPKLTFEATLSVADNPIVAYNEAIHGPGYSTKWPVLRCQINPNSFMLEILEDFTISSIDIKVEAVGLKDLVLQNDESIQPVDKPVLPFGSFPRIKNNFYIGSREVFSKSLQSLTLYLEWQDAPENFHHYYEGYDGVSIEDEKFTTDMFLLAGKSWNTWLLKKSYII